MMIVLLGVLDVDVGLNGKFFIFVLLNDGYNFLFFMFQENGFIFIFEELDREKIDRYYIYFMVFDYGILFFKFIVNFMIYFLDINDNLLVI